MTPDDFFQNPETTRILERSVRAAAVPASIHRVAPDRSEKKLWGSGACAACRYVAAVRGGQEACAQSRVLAESAALRTHMATPFICHMGLVCMTSSLQGIPFPDLAITFGPYCPPEGKEGLGADLARGLMALRGGMKVLGESLPFPLDDIRVVPAGAIPPILDWTLEALREHWRRWNEPVSGGREEAIEADGAVASASPHWKRKASRPQRVHDPYEGAAIAAALIAGSQDQARALVRAQISEVRGGKRPKQGVRRARTLAVVAAALESAAHAGIGTESAMGAFPGFLDEVSASSTDLQRVSAAMRVLGHVKRRARKEAPEAAEYAELNRLLVEHLAEGITLEDVAQALGEKPTTITRRLQRKFGLSFSEYIGRLRVERAKELLRRTRLSVTETARRVGIDDVSNFVKLFRKFEPTTPQEYREKYGKRP